MGRKELKSAKDKRKREERGGLKDEERTKVGRKELKSAKGRGKREERVG